MGYYNKSYQKPTETTERIWAVNLAEQFIITAKSASKFWQVLSNPHIKMDMRIYEQFLSNFNRLFSDTHMYAIKEKKRESEEDIAAKELINNLKTKFFAIAEKKRKMWEPMKDKELIELYKAYWDYNEILHNSPLMKIIEEANIMFDSGS